MKDAPGDQPRPNRKRERGIALLLTLGILSLLLVLAMGFAYNSRTNLIASEINADMVRARLLCESGLERALAYVRVTFQNQAPNVPRDYYPASSGVLFTDTNAASGAGSDALWRQRSYAVSRQTSTAVDRHGLGEALGTSLFDAADNEFEFIPTRTDSQIAGSGEMGPNASWQHIRAPEPFTDTNTNGSWDTGEPYVDVNSSGSYDSEVTGRIAFIMVDESGKLDPQAILTHAEPFYDANGNGVFDSATELYYDIDGDGAYDANGSAGVPIVPEGMEARVGRSPQEIDLRSALPSTMGGGYARFLSEILHTSGELTDWFSWHHLWKGMPRSYMPAAEAEVCTRTLFPYSYDIEAYWDSAGAVDRHRFDLSGYDAANPGVNLWENKTSGITVQTLTLGGAGGTQPAFWDTSTTPPQPAAVPATSKGIPWLLSISEVDGAGNPVRNQVAANLIDYCDTDSEATTDVVVASGGPKPTTTPTYVGLERVPYINETMVMVMFDYDDKMTPTMTDNDADVYVTVALELVNIYDTPVSITGGTVWIDLQVVLNPGLPSQRIEQKVIAATVDPVTVPANSYQGLTEGSGLTSANAHYDYGYSAGPPVVLAAGSVSVQITDCMVVVNASGGAADFADMGPNPGAAATPTSIFDARYASTQVVDPRANTGNSDWTWGGFDSDPTAVATLTLVAGAGMPPTVTATGAVNSNSDPSTAANVDAETVTDPSAGLSTAYIRNSPMESLWELGAIHRGEAWRTLNLGAYGGTGGYMGGDARILDQVKLRPELVTRGKVNPNTPSQFVWSALLRDIQLGVGASATTYESPATLGAPAIDITVAAGLWAAIRGNQPFAGRGGIASVVELTDGTVITWQDSTDRQQEEVIGKLANLLTVRQNYFTAIVVAQAVKDMGRVPVGVPAAQRSSNWRKYLDGDGDGDPSTESSTDGWCAVLAEQKIQAVVYRDAYTNDFRIERFEYLDD